jgi:predicted DNA-binding transcriptional regulator YafY
MTGEERMDPLERLLNLVGLLLETPTPLTFEQIRDTLDAYRADNVDSAKRMFERDKDQLRAAIDSTKAMPEVTEPPGVR